MRSFLRRLFCFSTRERSFKPRQGSKSSSTRMSSSVTAAALYAATISPSSITGAVPEESKERRHHLKDGKGFTNPWDSWKEMSGPSILKAMSRSGQSSRVKNRANCFPSRRLTGSANIPNTTPPTVPVRKPTFLPTRDTQVLRATWLGHACYFIEFPGGFRVLFDPVFSERCSPFSWLGPKRYTEVPCQVEDIPAIDAVVISHSHYDHLDHPTIMKIKAKHPNVYFFVPLGNKQWFTASGIEACTELDWWEERDMKIQPAQEKPRVISSSGGSQSDQSAEASLTARFGCLPCQHTSGRTLFDKGHTLWASWSVESGGKKIWFGGDTGYRAVPELPKGVDDYGPEHNYPHCPAFKDIGNLRGPFDLGLIPIGAYDPRFISKPLCTLKLDFACS